VALDIKAADWRSADRLQPPAPLSGAAAVIRLELHCFQDVNFSKLESQDSSPVLHGDGSVVNGLLELLCNNCVQIMARDLAAPTKKSVVFPPGSLRHVGFNVDEGLFPFPRRSFLGISPAGGILRLSRKVLFSGPLRALKTWPPRDSATKSSCFSSCPNSSAPTAGNRSNWASPRAPSGWAALPAVNLFHQVAEPILMEQKKFEYRIVADARREEALDIFSVDEVTGVMGGSSETVEYQPFFSHRHSGIEGPTQTFWHATRKLSGWRTNKASDTYITFVDLTGAKKTPDKDSITLRLTCSNGELPARLPFGSDASDFQLGAGGPITRIVALTKPTDALQPPQGKGLLWRLISKLSLNYLSLVSEGGDAFREILRLHNFTGSISADKQIDGILSLRSEPHFARLTSSHGVSFARGTRVEIELDEDQFTGVGAYTFSAVMDVFLGLYTSMNSFSQLVVRTRQRKRVLKQWPPRAGQKILM
jgi:type VI secretion system protein ImpG